jgi:hypothetical protein
LLESLLGPLFGQAVPYVDPRQTAFDPVVISRLKSLRPIECAKKHGDFGGVIILEGEGRSACRAKAALSDR